MHGVTGRMGMNQHLIRSIVAIRDQGGVVLADGSRVMPDPILIGRNLDKITQLAQAHGIERFGSDLDAALANPDDTLFFDAGTTQMRPELLSRAIAAGKNVYCEKPVATNLEEALKLYQLAQKAGIKHGVVQDKLFLPGLQKLAMLKRSGFFGDILSVRGEFGYWVFEGDLQPAQRPSWNYRQEDGGGIILDMICHWRYVLDNLFGAVKSVSCIGATHIDQRIDEAGKSYKATADDAAYATFELDAGQAKPVIAQINSSWCTRVRRDDLVRQYPKAGLESRRQTVAQVHGTLAASARHGGLRQRLQDAVGDVHPPSLRRHPVQVEPARGRQGRPAGRMRTRIVAATTLDRCTWLAGLAGDLNGR